MENFESKNKLNNQSIAETREALPNVQIDFFFIPHGTSIDASRLKEHLEKADVYVPEIYGAGPRELEFYRQVSRGELNPESIKKGMSDAYEGVLKHTEGMTVEEIFMYEELRQLYKSNKVILFVDIEAGTPEAIEYEKLKNEYQPFSNMGEVLRETNLEKFIESQKKLFDNIIKQKLLREKVIRRNIKSKLAPENLAHIPGLESKKDIKVLILLGFAHTTLPYSGEEKISEADNKNYSLHLGRQYYVSPISEEITKRKLAGKPVEDVLYARVLIENFA